MPRKTSKEFKIKELHYYVVDFRDFMHPELFPVYFVNKNIANRVLKANFPNRNDQKKFSIMMGKHIKNEHIPYKIASGNWMHYGSKYLYPDTVRTKQDRKSFRTLLRRRLRRMGLLTTAQPKNNIYADKIKKVEYKQNTQEVAKSPNTAARCFQLDRKPKSYYYIILKKRLSRKRGKLFKLKTIRVNIKTGEFRLLTLHTMRNDIFIPELITNLKKIPNAEAAITAYETYKGKQKKVSG